MGPGAIKWLPLPPHPTPPRPGTALGSGRAQKTGSIGANNSAADPVRAAQASGRRGLGPVPAPPGRAEAGRPWTPPRLPGRLSRGSATGTPTWCTRRRRRGEMGRKGETYLGAKVEPGAAGVCAAGPGGRRRRPAPRRAGLHLARTGNSRPAAPRRAPRRPRTERRRHAPPCASVRVGPAPSSRAARLPHRPHPVTSAALHSFLFDTSTGYSASASSHPLSPRASAAPSAPNFPCGAPTSARKPQGPRSWAGTDL